MHILLDEHGGIVITRRFGYKRRVEVFMKLFVIAILSVFSLQSFAEFKRPIASEIQNADIVCVNAQKNIEISINAVKGHIWFRNLDSNSNIGLEVQGPVFSGILSSEKYTGEVLGEIKLSQADYYVTIIMRSKNSSAQMETLLYPKSDQTQVVRFFSDKCDLR